GGRWVSACSSLAAYIRLARTSSSSIRASTIRRALRTRTELPPYAGAEVPMPEGYEYISDPLASRARFFRRLGANIALAVALIAVSLFAGMAGYHWLGGL